MFKAKVQPINSSIFPAHSPPSSSPVLKWVNLLSNVSDLTSRQLK